jgi:hypothetical protein
MNDQDAWAPAPWLPVRVRRQLVAADAREAVQEQRDVAGREARDEARRAGAVALYVEQAAARGEDVSALDVATGRVSGRGLDEIFGDALEAASRADAVSVARASREGTVPEPVHVFAGEPVIHQPAQQQRGAVALAMANMRRHFDDRRAARRRADQADERLHWGLVDGVTPKPRRDPLIDGTARR